MSLDQAGQEPRFPALRIRRVARTRSTQDIVLHAARSGAAEGFCCLAGEQTAGRGRQGRAWSAPAGSSLLVSVLLRRPAAVAVGIPFAAGLACIDALSATSGVAAGLKWPNDVLVGRRKLAGILSEVAPGSSLGGEVAIALGLGLNLTVDAFPAGTNAVSLHSLVGAPPDAEVLLRAWSTALASHLAALERGGIPAIAPAWRANAVGLGEPVSVHALSGSFEGIAVDIADDGALLVETDGALRRVLAGDVHLGRDTGG